MTLRLGSSAMVAAAASLLLSVLVIWISVRLARGNREDILATAPLTPQQEVALPACGEMLVLVEAPRMDLDYRNLQIDLTEKETGRSAAMRYRVATAAGAAYGVTTVRVPLGRMQVPRTAAYVVRAGGLTPGKDYSRYRLLFSRPYLRRLTLQIVGIVLCGVGALLALLRALWLAGLLQQPMR